MSDVPAPLGPLAHLDAGAALAVVVLPGAGTGFAWHGGSTAVEGAHDEAVAHVAAVERAAGPRWTWWSAAGTATGLVEAGVHLARCHDLAAVHRLLHGGSREDAGVVWAAAHDLPEPPPPSRRPPAAHGTGLLDLDGALDARPLDGAGQLVPGWLTDADVPPGERLDRAVRWAELALDVADRQLAALRALPDRRAQPVAGPLPVLAAHAESAAALLAVELGRTGLPVDRAVAAAVVTEVVGPRPTSPGQERAQREARDAPVRAALGAGPGLDLRNPAHVLAALRAQGFDVADTRGWRLERLRGTHAGVDALLRWRKAERLATTYGHAWLDTHVDPDGRLRGAWSAADTGAGRMTAQAGLHNLPAELRPAVAAAPGFALVRADLGQVEPRVLAAVSGDRGLVAAAAEDDLYSPVAQALGTDRPTAKVAVLAAMYGQTSGTAGRALQRMESAYPTAISYLRGAERAGVEGRDMRTFSGRRLRLAELSAAGPTAPEAVAGRGRFARNAVVQGAAAELFKAWAATVRAGLAGTAGRTVLCLHDELLLHVPAADADRAAALLRDALAATARWWAAGSGVRFVVDVSVVQRWSEAK